MTSSPPICLPKAPPHWHLGLLGDTSMGSIAPPKSQMPLDWGVSGFGVFNVPRWSLCVASIEQQAEPLSEPEMPICLPSAVEEGCLGAPSTCGFLQRVTPGSCKWPSCPHPDHPSRTFSAPGLE